MLHGKVTVMSSLNIVGKGTGSRTFSRSEAV